MEVKKKKKIEAARSFEKRADILVACLRMTTSELIGVELWRYNLSRSNDNISSSSIKMETICPVLCRKITTTRVERST
jgi:hypothetical protein